MHGGQDEERERTDAPETTGDDGVAPAEPPDGETSVFDLPSAGPDILVDDSSSDDTLVDIAPEPAPPPPPVGPNLPASAAKAPPPMVDPIAQPRPGATTWYRTDEERSKSVYRRANPWYRRLARGVIGLAFLAVAAVGLYAGARAIQGWLERDQLPSAGAEVPDIRSTSFIVVSSTPAPTLDGTLTIDTETAAFEYVGRAGGPQSGIQLVSPDGSTTYVRQGTEPWRAASSNDAIANDVRTAVSYLVDADTADSILTNRLRRGFVELDAQVDEGSGDDRLTRYETIVDTSGFASEYPLQWEEYRDDAVPGAQEDPAVAVTIWLDDDDVLVRVRDETANWSWERLTYGDQPFRPVDPTDDSQTRIVQVACVSDDNRIFWQTPFPSCDLAVSTARTAAADAGVAEAFDDLDRTVARLCSTLEREEGPLPATTDEITLADALVAAGVCRGDPSIFAAG